MHVYGRFRLWLYPEAVWLTNGMNNQHTIFKWYIQKVSLLSSYFLVIGCLLQIHLFKGDEVYHQFNFRFSHVVLSLTYRFMESAFSTGYASFPFAFHIVFSNNAVKVRLVVVSYHWWIFTIITLCYTETHSYFLSKVATWVILLNYLSFVKSISHWRPAHRFHRVEWIMYTSRV